MPGTFKKIIDRVWKPFQSKNPTKPKKSGQRDERREAR